MNKIFLMLAAMLRAIVTVWARPIPAVELQRFAEGGTLVNTTTGTVNAYTGEATTSDAMTPGMKTYYDTELLENARDEAVYGQLGKQQPLPANHGKSVEWRKWNTLPEPDKLQEGVIPTAKKFGQSQLSVGIAQYGEYVTVSDQLELHHVDDVILGATEEVGAAMGKMADLLTRDSILAGATNVMIAPTVQDGLRYEHSVIWQIPATAKFTADLVARAVTNLKKRSAPTIGGKYVAVVHPSVAYDLRSDPQWIEYHKYAATTEIFNGEIGELHNVRFIEANHAPVMVGGTLYSDYQRYLTLTTAQEEAEVGKILAYGVSGTHSVTATESLSAEDCTADWAALIGQQVLLREDDGGIISPYKVTGVEPEANKIHIEGGPTELTGNAHLLPGNGGAEDLNSIPVAVYATMVFGKDAFGVINPEGAGLEMIIKDKSKAGGPLDQFSTIGGKMSHAARVLYPERMVCIYSASTYSDTDEGNWKIT